MKLTDLANEISTDFNWYYNNGYITDRDGNACAKFKDSFVVTASGVDKSKLSKNDLLILSGKDDVVKGSLKPSIETVAHIESLSLTGKKYSVHVHSPNTVALFELFDDTTSLYLENSLNNNWPELFRYTKVGRTVSVLPPGSEQLHNAIKDSFADKPDIVVMKRHGVITNGNTLKECREHILRLEHVCGILLKTLSCNLENIKLIL
jgi:methylthioribulose-1-phosphate dehydratase